MQLLWKRLLLTTPRPSRNRSWPPGQHLKLVWLLQDRRTPPPFPRIRPASYWGIHRAWELSTAAVWVDNCRRGERGKRKGQHYLQTWHGFALKRIEADAEQALDGPYVRGCMQDSAQCDLMVSGSGFMTQLYQRAFWYDGPVAEYGSPRNDVLFSSQPHLLQKVRQAFSLPENQKLVLYAPTFRSDHSSRAYNLDVPSLLDACHTRFGGSWSCLVRLHPNVAKHSTGLFAYNGSTILDATAYPDMQELLYAVDMLISDYPLVCLTCPQWKALPAICHTDIESYRQDRNFYFPWTAFPLPSVQQQSGFVSGGAIFDAQEYARTGPHSPRRIIFAKTAMPQPVVRTGFWARLGRKGENAMKRVITYGTFDLLHYGHINLLRRAKALGDYLIVGLSTDQFNWQEKQKKSYFTYEERKAMLEAIRYVDLVIPEENWDQKNRRGKNTMQISFVIGDD